MPRQLTLAELGIKPGAGMTRQSSDVTPMYVRPAQQVSLDRLLYTEPEYQGAVITNRPKYSAAEEKQIAKATKRDLDSLKKLDEFKRGDLYKASKAAQVGVGNAIELTSPSTYAKALGGSDELAEALDYIPLPGPSEIVAGVKGLGALKGMAMLGRFPEKRKLLEGAGRKADEQKPMLSDLSVRKVEGYPFEEEMRIRRDKWSKNLGEIPVDRVRSAGVGTSNSDQSYYRQVEFGKTPEGKDVKRVRTVWDNGDEGVTPWELVK